MGCRKESFCSIEFLFMNVGMRRYYWVKAVSGSFLVGAVENSLFDSSHKMLREDITAVFRKVFGKIGF